MTPAKRKGRPPLPVTEKRGASRPLMLKLTAAERETIDTAAASLDELPSVWARNVLLRAAKRLS